MARISHYFTPFQTHVVSQAENDISRFAMEQALLVLEREAKYKAEGPSLPGLFVFQFEALSRNRLGYTKGLAAMAADPFYTEDWQRLHPHPPHPAGRRRFRRPDLRPLGVIRQRTAAAEPRLRPQVPDPLRREGRQDRPRQPGPRPDVPVLGPAAPARLPRGPPAPPARRARGPRRCCSSRRSPSSKTASRPPRARSSQDVDLAQVLVKPEDTAGPPEGMGAVKG